MRIKLLASQGLGFVLLVAVSLVYANTAQAMAVLGPDVQFEVGIIDDTQVLHPFVDTTEIDNRFNLTGVEVMSDTCTLTWNMTVDADPFINAVFGLTNNTDYTQTFVLNVTLPISPAITPSSLMGGSVGGSVTDANFDGVATVANAGNSPLYDGMIDGTGVLPIITSPFSYSAPFAGGTANITATNVGLPGLTTLGPQALASIGINHTFTLTPGDTVSLTSFFVVVPEPASFSLMACGLILVGLRRR